MRKIFDKELAKALLIEAVANSHRLSEVMEKLDFKYYGANYRLLSKYVKKFELDTSHFYSRSELAKKSKTKKIDKVLSFDEIFSINNLGRGFIKNYILDNNLMEYKCAICGLAGEYNGKKLILQLDHINGESNDNSYNNIRLICGSCHSQTDTYCGKNNFIIENNIKHQCIICNAQVSEINSKCRSCAGKSANRNIKPKINYPSYEELLKLTDEKGFLQAGKLLGVSDNAIRRHLIKMHPNNVALRDANIPSINGWENDIGEAIKICFTYVGVLKQLNIKYKTLKLGLIKNYIANNNIDISHFKVKNKKELTYNDIFCVNDLGNNIVKNYIIENNLLELKCNICNIPNIWNEKELVLQLDHIDGNNKNNSFENCRLICCNCHTQTDTYCRSKPKSIIYKKCVDCDAVIDDRSERCRHHAAVFKFTSK